MKDSKFTKLSFFLGALVTFFFLTLIPSPGEEQKQGKKLESSLNGSPESMEMLGNEDSDSEEEFDVFSVDRDRRVR